MDTLGYFNIKKPDVVHETIDGETVIVNLENGVYYSLRNSGVDIWNLIEAGANFEELTAEIGKRYLGAPAEIQKAIRELLITLQKEGLLQVSSTRRTESLIPPAPMAAARHKKIKFENPILEKYSDMQELLLLDPIHEVDEDGWPNKVEDGGQTNAGGQA
jgi:hypothetical protein